MTIRSVYGVGCALLILFALIGSTEGRPAAQDDDLTAERILPPRSDLTVLQWESESSLEWSFVARRESGEILELAQSQPAKDQWTATVVDATHGWWIRYTLDLGLDESVAEETPEDLLEQDWYEELSRLQREGRLRPTHRMETSDGISLSMEDSGNGDVVQQLGRRFGELQAQGQVAVEEETLGFLMSLALDGYFRDTGQMVSLIRILSAGQLDSSSVLDLRPRRERKTGRSEGDGEPEGASSPTPEGEGALQADPTGDPTPQTQFCNGDPDHYAHQYPYEWDLCTKSHNPHYPSYQIPPHCEDEPGCTSCHRRAKTIGSCCDCCESQYQEKINCDCWIGSLGGCEVLAQANRSKCLNEGCQGNLLADCP